MRLLLCVHKLSSVFFALPQHHGAEAPLHDHPLRPLTPTDLLRTLDPPQLILVLGLVVVLFLGGYAYMHFKYPKANNSLALVAGFSLADAVADLLFIHSMQGVPALETERALCMAFLGGSLGLNLVAVAYVMTCEFGFNTVSCS